jgi:hypothetical protein
VALALFFAKTKLAADVFVRIIGCCFRDLDSKSVSEVGPDVIARGLHFVETLRGFEQGRINLQAAFIIEVRAGYHGAMDFGFEKVRSRNH